MNEILNLKNILIKRLQEENEKLHHKCNKLEKSIIPWKKKISILLTILCDIDVSLDVSDIEDFHRFDKSKSKIHHCAIIQHKVLYESPFEQK